MNTAGQDGEGWLSLTAAAELLGSTPLNVLMHVKRGLLLGEEDEDGWRIDPATLAILVRKRREEGVPVVCQSGCAKRAGGCGSCT